MEGEREYAGSWSGGWRVGLSGRWARVATGGKDLVDNS